MSHKPDARIVKAAANYCMFDVKAQVMPLVVTRGILYKRHWKEQRMKGPFERLKYDLRRLWECPLCHRRERTEGNSTARQCGCAAKTGGAPVAMKLVEDGPRRVDGQPMHQRRCSGPAAEPHSDNLPAPE